jgi:hypothetical protein
VIDTAPLIVEITAAFDGVAREDGVSLREGIVMDDYGPEEQRAAARLLDTDTRWQDVSDDDMQRYEVSLSFFDAKGFRYYLPAYMLRDLRLNIDAEHGISSDTLYSLSLAADTRLRNFQLERFSLLTPPQGQAVCRFLRFVAIHTHKYDREYAADALADYWSRYCNEDAE